MSNLFIFAAISALLLVHYSNGEIVDDLILAIPDVIHGIQNENGGGVKKYTDLVHKIAEKMPKAVADYQKKYHTAEKHRAIKKEEAVRQLEEEPRLREQMAKLFILMEMREVISQVKASKHPHVHPTLAKEKALRDQIKDAVFKNIASKGLKVMDEKDEKNVKAIIAILLLIHEDDLVEIEEGKKGKEHRRKVGRKLRIAQVAPNFTQTPPRAYGGTERIVSYLCEELAKRGHEITLFASADSITTGKLIFKEPALFKTDEAKLKATNHWIMEQVGMRVDHREFDIIHFHTDFGWDKVEAMVANGANAVATIHFLIKSPELAVLGTKYSNIPLISISDDQPTHKPKNIPAAQWHANFLKPTVYHGLPGDMYKFVSKKEQVENLAKSKYGPKPYLSFLGRISPPKRPDMAIRIAAVAKTSLRIAAAINSEDKLYWELGIKPLITLVNGQHREMERIKGGGDKKEGMAAKHGEEIKLQQEKVHIIGGHLKKLAEFNGIEEEHGEEIAALKGKYESAIAAFDGRHAELMATIARYAKNEAEEEKAAPPLVKYIGQVNDEEKNDFLGNSVAQLFPIYWNEPFGLVMIESMAVGTPVITRKIGSVGEVIKPHVSGLIFGEGEDVNEEEEIARAAAQVKEVEKIDRRGVRDEFERRFTVEKMADGYEAMFERMMEGEIGGGGKKKMNGEVEEGGQHGGGGKMRQNHHQVEEEEEERAA